MIASMSRIAALVGLDDMHNSLFVLAIALAGILARQPLPIL